LWGVRTCDEGWGFTEGGDRRKRPGKDKNRFHEVQKKDAFDEVILLV